MNHRALRRKTPALVVRHGQFVGVGVLLPVGEGDFVAADGEGLIELDRSLRTLVVIAATAGIANAELASRNHHHFGALSAPGQGVADGFASSGRQVNQQAGCDGHGYCDAARFQHLHGVMPPATICVFRRSMR